MFSYKNNHDTDKEECSLRSKSTVRDIDQAFTRLGKNIAPNFWSSKSVSSKKSALSCLSLITESNMHDDKSSQSQSYPTNQLEGNSLKRQGPSISSSVPQKRLKTCSPSPESKYYSSDARRLMPPPPIPPLPRQRPQREKLTTEQVVRVFIQMRWV